MCGSIKIKRQGFIHGQRGNLCNGDRLSNSMLVFKPPRLVLTSYGTEREHIKVFLAKFKIRKIPEK